MLRASLLAASSNSFRPAPLETEPETNTLRPDRTSGISVIDRGVLAYRNPALDVS